MGPPPPRNPNPNANPDREPELSNAERSLGEAPQPSALDKSGTDEESNAPLEESDKEEPHQNPNPNPSSSPSERGGKSPVPYSIPPWSEPPTHRFFLEVLKDGSIIEQLDVSKKGAYMFGRVDLCDFILEHQTISRFHAVLQFKKDEVLLYDLGSTHGTSVNKKQVKKKVYMEIHVGDVIRFGQSSRLYIFQGPSELMPPEGDFQKLREARIQEELLDREASLSRARAEASLAEGISWGIAEDAVEEAGEDDADEVTWQAYKGQLTERQEKTRSKITKRMEKVANMKKEIDAIRSKDIAQGGLTQGQQTQIARNEQRISQIMEELESLEETLNESIRESLGARAGKVAHGWKKGSIEDDDDILSDDDDFYDRTKKPSSQKSSEQQSVETADTLLDKKDAITGEMEDKRKLLENEKNKLPSSAKNKEGNDSGENNEDGDDLDAYMTGLSSQLVHDRIAQIQKELSDLQAEYDKVTYLLKIADPTGEASWKRGLKAQEPTAEPTPHPQPLSKEKQIALPETAVVNPQPKEPSHSKQVDQNAKEGSDIPNLKENGVSAFSLTKPQWLGAMRDTKPEENEMQEVKADAEEPDNFVDYKDRKKILQQLDTGKEMESTTAGLIIRKRKHLDSPESNVDKVQRAGDSSAGEAETSAADAVALLLKHKRGYHALEDDEQDGNQLKTGQKKEKKEKSQPKRVFGPSRPDFLNNSPDYETWVPPEGQTGDGRTSLNDRLGY
uniref:FHA domain-containing protein n=1 Tax=Ananas comosus var. bracteatus TaxID=296719 RepID=A0A6V7P751_ANACO|nr:unnamed protein product [Ananas comosus var. bracteatus]